MPFRKSASSSAIWSRSTLIFAALVPSVALVAYAANNGGRTTANAIATIPTHITQKRIKPFPFRFHYQARHQRGGVRRGKEAPQQLSRGAVSHNGTEATVRSITKQMDQTRAGTWLDRRADDRARTSRNGQSER